MNTIILGIGYFVVVAIGLLLLLSPLRWQNNGGFVSITYFGFGLFWAKSNDMIAHCSKLRKVERQRLYIEAPYWFNHYVYNFGTRGEE